MLTVGFGAALWLSHGPAANSEALYEPRSRVLEPGALCPWREPEEDLRRFFPGATGFTNATMILSHQRLELEQRLGRAPLGDENSLLVHRVLGAGEPSGSILTRRVKGEHGLIEIVLAVDNHQQVCGLRLQRLREPDPVAQALQDPAWLKAFNGRGPALNPVLGMDIPEVPAVAQASAQAVLDGVRSLLILLAVAEEQSPAYTHHH